MSWLSDRVNAVAQPLNSIVDSGLRQLPTANLAAQLKEVGTQIDPTNLTKQEATALVKAGALAITGNYSAAAATVAQGYQQSRSIAAGKQQAQAAADAAALEARNAQIVANNIDNLNGTTSASSQTSPAAIGGVVLALLALM